MEHNTEIQRQVVNFKLISVPGKSRWVPNEKVLKTMFTRSLTLATAIVLTCSSIAFAQSSMSAHVEQASMQGTFEGASEHITTGNVQVTKYADGRTIVVLGDNFDFDGAPDPRVGLGKNGEYGPTTDIGLLKSDSGLQTYVVPANNDVDEIDEVYL